MPITVYTTPTCGYCHQVKNYLSRKGVPFAEKDVSRDQTAAQEMVRKSGQMGVPVIDIDGQIVVGFNMGELERLLARRTSKVSLGLKVADAASMARKRGGGPSSGAYVGAVERGAPGQQAGLQVGDVIVSLAGRNVGDAEDVSHIMATLQPGESVEISYVRDGQNLHGKATL